MKVKTHPTGCPDITLGKLDVNRLEGGYTVLEELAFKGRQGCCVHGAPYNGEMMEKIANYVLSILAAYRRSQQPSGDVQAALPQPPNSKVDAGPPAPSGLA